MSAAPRLSIVHNQVTVYVPAGCALAIPWPPPVSLMSARDTEAPSLAAASKQLTGRPA
jgi:hypothetical protein